MRSLFGGMLEFSLSSIYTAYTLQFIFVLYLYIDFYVSGIS